MSSNEEEKNKKRSGGEKDPPTSTKDTEAAEEKDIPQKIMVMIDSSDDEKPDIILKEHETKSNNRDLQNTQGNLDDEETVKIDESHKMEKASSTSAPAVNQTDASIESGDKSETKEDEDDSAIKKSALSMLSSYNSDGETNIKAGQKHNDGKMKAKDQNSTDTLKTKEGVGNNDTVTKYASKEKELPDLPDKQKENTETSMNVHTEIDNATANVTANATAERESTTKDEKSSTNTTNTTNNITSSSKAMITSHENNANEAIAIEPTEHRKEEKDKGGVPDEIIGNNNNDDNEKEVDGNSNNEEEEIKGEVPEQEPTEKLEEDVSSTEHENTEMKIDDDDDDDKSLDNDHDSESNEENNFKHEDTEYEEDAPINIVLNPVSEWEEPIEVPSLTLFDMHRCPRKVNTDPTVRVTLPLKDLTSEFQCPICLGYMKKTAIVMECLHRFCGECIQKCLRLGKKECPSCRIHIPTRRSLRPDPSFDQLVRNIYGDLDTLEGKIEKEIERMNKLKNMNNAYSESRKRGILQQAKMRKKRQIGSRANKDQGGNKNNQNGTTNAQTDQGTNQIAGLEETTLVSFFLRKHPHETLVDKLEREYIRSSRDLTMRHLKLFLSRKLGYPISSHFQILAISKGKGMVLDDNVPLGDLEKFILDTVAEETFLYYRVVPK